MRGHYERCATHHSRRGAPRRGMGWSGTFSCGSRPPPNAPVDPRYRQVLPDRQTHRQMAHSASGRVPLLSKRNNRPSSARFRHKPRRRRRRRTRPAHRRKLAHPLRCPRRHRLHRRRRPPPAVPPRHRHHRLTARSHRPHARARRPPPHPGHRSCPQPRPRLHQPARHPHQTRRLPPSRWHPHRRPSSLHRAFRTRHAPPALPAPRHAQTRHPRPVTSRGATRRQRGRLHHRGR